MNSIRNLVKHGSFYDKDEYSLKIQEEINIQRQTSEAQRRIQELYIDFSFREDTCGNELEEPSSIPETILERKEQSSQTLTKTETETENDTIERTISTISSISSSSPSIQQQPRSSLKLELLRHYFYTNLPENANIVSPKWREFSSLPNLERYLISSNGNLKEAKTKLKRAIQYREKYCYEGATCSLCRVDPASHCMISLGIGKYGLGILYIAPSRATNLENLPTCLHLLLEHDKTFLLPESCGKMVWVMDFNGYTIKHSMMNPTIAIHFAKLLSSCLPERIYAFIMMDTPSYFMPILKMAKMFLDERTWNKIIFCNRDGTTQRSVIPRIVKRTLSIPKNSLSYIWRESSSLLLGETEEDEPQYQEIIPHYTMPQQNESYEIALERICNPLQKEWILRMNNETNVVAGQILFPLPEGSPLWNSGLPFE